MASTGDAEQRPSSSDIHHHPPSNNTPSGLDLQGESGSRGEGRGGGRRRVESIQLSVNLAQAGEPLTPQASCYQLTLTPTQSDAIILLQRLH